MASLSRDTTSTADGASTVRRLSPQAEERLVSKLYEACHEKRLMCFREETVGCRSVSGDKHTLQVLVILPEGQFQQEDVRGVQTVRAGRRQRKQQVRTQTTVFLCQVLFLFNRLLEVSDRTVIFS